MLHGMGIIWVEYYYHYKNQGGIAMNIIWVEYYYRYKSRRCR